MYNLRSVPNRQACLLVFSRPREPVVDHESVVKRQYATGGGFGGPRRADNRARSDNEQSACRISTGPVATHLCSIVSTK